jgi:hypothetical protein
LRQRHDNGVTQGARLIDEESRLGEEPLAAYVVLGLLLAIFVQSLVNRLLS